MYYGSIMAKGFTINDLPADEKPRERLLRVGEQALSIQELLQLVLGRGINGQSVTLIAQKLITNFGSLDNLSQASIEELSSIKGIGLAKAAQIKAVFEISKRLNTPQIPTKIYELSDPKNVHKLIYSKLKNYTREHFYLITVNTRNFATHEISIGTLTTSLVHPREVFSEAIKHNAAGVIFAHNHPSGNTQPSDADIKTTRELIIAGNILGIKVLDHIIVTKSHYFSFKENGLI